MSERLNEHRDDLREIELHGRTLADWHKYLTVDSEGHPSGHLEAPASRYGRDGDSCAWWAIAGGYAFELAGGVVDDPEASVEWFQNDAINDRAELLELVREYWFHLPVALRDLLDYEDNGLNMNQQAALRGLCGRYNVPYNAEHYTPQFDLPDSWVAGWVGGFAIQKEHPTIYVGCSEAGEVSS